jgi:tetratricopeptide (TPR) repeat protein
MLNKPAFLVLMILMATALLAPSSAAQAPAKGVDAANAALAERMAQLADVALAERIDEATLAQSAALLEAATRLNPSEPRFLRLLLDAQLQLGHLDRAIETLNAYRRLEPADQVAQLRLVELFYSQMESADERMKYLSSLVATEGAGSIVRSHAAARLSVLLADRAQETEAQAMLARALELNPLNLEALRAQHALALAEGDAVERVRAALAWLRGNPLHPDLMAQIADETADAGLPDRSAAWYARSFTLSNRLGQPISPSLFAEYAAALYLGEQAKAAEAALTQMLEVDPRSSNGWFLRLVIARDTNDPQEMQRVLGLSREAMINQVNALHRELTGKDPATRPGDQIANRLPNLQEDAKRLAEGDRPELREVYAALLSDLAWHQVYFERQPAAAGALIDAVRLLAPADHPVVTRLEGWAFLVAERHDEARVKLSAAAERDPLAAMGLILLEPDETKRSAAAQELVQRHRGGVLGAMLLQGLRPHGAKLTPADDAPALQAQIEQFPIDWLDFSERPEQFYSLKAAALKVAHQFGEPVLIRVSITNLRDFPITIDQQGALRPDLWVDAQLRAPVQQQISGVAYDRLAQRIVLGPKETISQIIRVDRGAATPVLGANPTHFIPVFFSVVTNPLTTEQGVRPGPGGLRAHVDRVVERTASPIATPHHQQQILAQLAGGDPAGKIRTIDLAAAHVREIRSRQDAAEEMRKLADALAQAIEAAGEDAAAPAAAWARYVAALLAPAEKRAAQVEHLAAAGQWERRLLALAAAGQVDVETARRVAEKLAKDQDATVSRYARGIVAAMAQPETTETAP